MRKVMICILIILVVQVSSSKEVHRVAVGSTGNIIELTIENASSLMANDIHVKAMKIPSWIHMNVTEMAFDQVKPGGEKPATFTFSIDRTAPINSEQTLHFTISTLSGEEWAKEITISVSPPEKFELLQNYPNPFNPQTSIEYILPKSEEVKLVVYDVLGQEVQTLVDEVQNPGYKSIVFNANSLPSGVYIYKFTAGTVTDVKKMILMR